MFTNSLKLDWAYMCISINNFSYSTVSDWSVCVWQVDSRTGIFATALLYHPTCVHTTTTIYTTLYLYIYARGGYFMVSVKRTTCVVSVPMFTPRTLSLTPSLCVCVYGVALGISFIFFLNIIYNNITWAIRTVHYNINTLRLINIQEDFEYVLI